MTFISNLMWLEQFFSNLTFLQCSGAKYDIEIALPIRDALRNQASQTYFLIEAFIWQWVHRIL